VDEQVRNHCGRFSAVAPTDMRIGPAAEWCCSLQMITGGENMEQTPRGPISPRALPRSFSRIRPLYARGGRGGRCAWIVASRPGRAKKEGYQLGVPRRQSVVSVHVDKAD
jgi:hypothetical protein